MDSIRRLEQIQQEAISAIQAAATLTDLEAANQTFLGKKSQFVNISQDLKTASPEEKRQLGQTLNQVKQTLQQAVDERRATLSKNTQTTLDIDTSLPGIQPKVGHLHPTTIVVRKINSFFRYLGYSVYEGPEIENNEFNFEKLNLPQDHPARDLADTLYISEPEILLRTHTSSVETRAMTQESLPLRIVVPGKVYRNENSNTTNNSMFYQYEGLVVDKGISMANLKGTLNRFARFLYGDDVVTRFRCKYYPQVEPGAGMDIQCTFCNGAGCSVCKYRGWIEVLGSGMVHPNVLTKCGIDNREYSGFAFGMGLDRLVMLTYGINDIRKLYNGELFYES